MSQRALTTLTAAWITLLTSTAVHSAQVRGSGEAAYVPVYEATVALEGGRSLRHYRTEGFVTSDPDSLFHRTEQSCSGTDLLGPDGAVINGAGYCDGTDPVGDVWWIWFRGDQTGGTWGFLGGTGKFEGLKGGGSTRYVHRWPDGKFTIKWEGSWEAD